MSCYLILGFYTKHMGQIKLFIVDDHTMLLDALKFYFDEDSRFKVVGTANNGLQALKAIQSNSGAFDLLITDILMPEMDGIELISKLSEHDFKFKILALTMMLDNNTIKELLRLDVNGVLFKSAGKPELFDAVLKVNSGTSYYSPEVVDSVMNHLKLRGSKREHEMSEPTLTKREKEILHMVIEEYSNSEIADQLCISHRTVEAHKHNILEKTGRKNFAGLAIWAFEKGLFSDQ